MQPDAAPNPLESLDSKTSPDLAGVIALALSDDTALAQLLDGLESRQDVHRFNCFQALLRLSADHPQRLYPAWDRLVALLDSANSYHRTIAVQLIANLASADGEGRFERLFTRYFDLLDDESIVTARYLAQSSGRIADAKPLLRSEIVARLLGVDRLHHEPSRKELLKADVIDALATCFESVDDRESIVAFVRAQLACGSPKARKAAKSFLGRFGT